MVINWLLKSCWIRPGLIDFVKVSRLSFPTSDVHDYLCSPPLGELQVSILTCSIRMRSPHTGDLLAIKTKLAEQETPIWIQMRKENHMVHKRQAEAPDQFFIVSL